MIRKEGSKQSEGGSDLQRAENLNLGLPNINRRFNFLYFSTYTNISFNTTHETHVIYENIRGEYMNISSNNFSWRV